MRHLPRSRALRAVRWLGALWLAAGAAGSLHAAVEVIDDAGQHIRLARPAQRIVALAPNLTELVFAAGAGERLRGVARHSDEPAAARRLPVVSDAHTLNLEAIAALRPDLVLVWQSGTIERQRDALKKLGLPVFESEIRSVEGIAGTLERIGVLAGTTAPAGQAARTLRADWQALAARYRDAAPVRVFYQVWPQPLLTFNGQHLVSVAMRACGGVGGFDTLAALTPAVSREAVLTFDPQLIVHGEPQGAALAGWQALPRIDAVRHGRLYSVDGKALTRMSPRFVAAAGALCELIDQTRRAVASSGTGAGAGKR